jgi:hypothetical protein
MLIINILVSLLVMFIISLFGKWMKNSTSNLIKNQE